MPLTGSRDIRPILAGSPLMGGFDTDSLTLNGVVTLQLIYEIRQEAMTSLLPPALHPTVPPTLFFVTWQVPESPFGRFTVSEVRVGCRSAARPRAFLARGYCDSPEAIRELSTRWGYPLEHAAVKLRRNYDRVNVTVEADGQLILDASLINPEPISGGDIQYLANVNLTRVVREGQEVPRLVQVDPDYVFHRADRGRPKLDRFDAGAWLLDGADPWWGVSASVSTADMVLPKLRYIMDPEKPPLQAIERV